MAEPIDEYESIPSDALIESIDNIRRAKIVEVQRRCAEF